MKISKKRTVQVMVFAIALLLVLALSIGITGAWYQAKRQASGTVIMDQGIIIDYKGFAENAPATTWGKGVNLKLFETTDAQPGQQIAVNASSIRANVESVDFYARVKLDYKFYNVVKSTEEGVDDTKTEVELDDASKLITTSTSFFGDSWVESADGWFYYGTDTTLGKLTPSAEDTAFVSLFADGAKFIIEGANFVGADNEGEGGGFKVGDKSINQIEVTITIETLQGSADAAGADWIIAPIIKEDISGLTSGSNTQIEDILTSTITETTEDVYLTGSPADPVTITIGSKAFAGCPKLVLNLSNDANIKYIIASDAFESTAKVNYGSTNIVDDIRAATQSYNADLAQMSAISGTKVYAYKPSTWTPPSNESGTASYGTYQYTDDQGTWYYDLIDENGNTVTTLSGSALSASALEATTNVTAKIKYVNNRTNLLIIPQYIQSTEAGSKRYVVTVLESYNNSSTILKYNSNVKTVTIPNSVTSIGDSVFGYCYALTSITIPDGVTSIGSNAFFDCKKLTSITIPDRVTSVGLNAFNGCSSLESIKVKEGNSKYHSAGNCLIETATGTLIRGCKNSIIPTNGSVTSIEQYAFGRCSGLTSITIPDTVISIGYGAFEDCSGLTSVTIGKGVTSIGPSAFSGCSSLESIKVKEGNSKYHSAGNCLIETATGTLIRGCKNTIIPNDDSVTSIGSNAFYKCSGLTSITIPASVTSIGRRAFGGCSGLESVIIGSGVTAIPDLCFYECTKLETVVIKGAITSIGSEAFYRCSALTTILINSEVTASLTGVSKVGDTLYTEQGEVFAGEPVEGTIYYKKYTRS